MVRRIQPDWLSPFILRRHLIRSNVPFAKGTSTGVHYDQIFLRAAPPTTLTAWVPIGDCGPMNGGLMYLENSVGIGERIEQGFTELCKQKGMPEEERLYAFNQNVGRTVFAILRDR
jgi:phytanoyl-CoA hydroxylase